jgi:hypothetical protein
MKTRIIAAFAVLAVLVAAFATVASAASEKTTTGTIARFNDKASNLIVKTKSGKVKFKITAKTNCGVSFGQSGDQIPCKSLGKSKYDGKPVRVMWTKKGDFKVASLVAVDLSK